MKLSNVLRSGWVVGLLLSGVACGGGEGTDDAAAGTGSGGIGSGGAPTGGNTSVGGTIGGIGGASGGSGGIAPGAGGTGGIAAGGTGGLGGPRGLGGTAGPGGTGDTGGTGGASGGSGGTDPGETGGAGGSTGGSGGTGGQAGEGCGAGLTPNVTVTTAAQLDTALTNAKSGDVISIAAGTYLLPGKSFKISASNVKIFGVAGQTLLDYQATATIDANPGIRLIGSSNTLCGLTIARAADNGIHITGDNNIVDRCETYECFDSGVQISGPEAETPPHPANNLILNCDSHDNYDTKASGGNADGFAAKINIGPGNKFFGCVAHDNSDDGWDTFPKTTSGTNSVTIENCVAYHNGYHNGAESGNGNGFKVGSDVTGGADHVLKNSVAFNNPSKGFDQNHNEGVASVDHCTAVNNDRNIAFQEFDGANITNSVANGGWEQAAGTDSGNVKNAATSAFTNLSPNSLSRDADGTLHLNGFAVYTASGAGAHF